VDLKLPRPKSAQSTLVPQHSPTVVLRVNPDWHVAHASAPWTLQALPVAATPLEHLQTFGSQREVAVLRVWLGAVQLMHFGTWCSGQAVPVAPFPIAAPFVTPLQPPTFVQMQEHARARQVSVVPLIRS
jgi:hypothetical protein